MSRFVPVTDLVSGAPRISASAEGERATVRLLENWAEANPKLRRTVVASA